jgi:hypothetical protein
MRIRLLATLFASTALLAACSSEPSESDINTAVREFYSHNGVLGSVQVNKVTKLQCVEEQGASSYVCDVQVNITKSFLGHAERPSDLTSKVRMLKTDNGWQAVG